MITIISILFVLYVCVFITALYLEDNGIADIFWWFGFMVIAGLWFFFYSDETLAQTLITFLIFMWWTRLTLHVGMRNLMHSKEDFRYAAWREEWTYVKTRSFFQVYMLQWLLMCIVATPLFLMNLTNDYTPSIILSGLGWAVALFGFFYEMRADKELAEFIKTKKKGQILTKGLRSYHRYPQYFGESMFWLGISIIASQASMFAFVWWIAITLLVRYVSGVPFLERRYEGDKKYAKYSEKTNTFIPDWTLIFKK